MSSGIGHFSPEEVNWASWRDIPALSWKRVGMFRPVGGARLVIVKRMPLLWFVNLLNVYCRMPEGVMM